MAKYRLNASNPTEKPDRHKGRPPSRLTEIVRLFTLKPRQGGAPRPVRSEYLVIKVFRGIIKLLQRMNSNATALSWISFSSTSVLDLSPLVRIQNWLLSIKSRSQVPKVVSGLCNFNSYQAKKRSRQRRTMKYYPSCSRGFRREVFADCPEMAGIVEDYMAFVFQKLGQDKFTDTISHSNLDTELMNARLGVYCCTNKTHGESCAERWRQLWCELLSSLLPTLP